MIEIDFYPSEFSPEARDGISREAIRACRELLPSSVYAYNEQNLAVPCIMRIFLAFAKEACALRTGRNWTIERVQRESEEFLRQLTIKVVFAKFPGLDQHWISNINGSLSSDVKRKFERSPEWKSYEDLLETPKTESTSRAKSAPEPIRNSEPRSILAQPRAAVDAFIARIREKTGREITRKDIYTAAGYKDRTQFERFQSGKRCTNAAKENFIRVMNLDPTGFFRELEKKKRY